MDKKNKNKIGKGAIISIISMILYGALIITRGMAYKNNPIVIVPLLLANSVIFTGILIIIIALLLLFILNLLKENNNLLDTLKQKEAN